MANNVWVVIADDMSFASVAQAGIATGAPVKALVFGPKERAEAVAAFAVESVLWFDDAAALPEALLADIREMAVADQPSAILCADEATARTITGFAAAAINAAATSSIVRVILGAPNKVEHLVAEGNSLEVIEATGPVAGSIVDGGADAEPTGATAPITAADLSKATAALKPLRVTEEEGGGASLTAAEKVVSCGIGIGPKDSIELVRELADALGAEMACSLPLCDNYHWFEHTSVVGTSTQKISPRLYVACGVSGQPQHMMGVRSAKTICAINIDPEAPIFKESAYGIIGDVKEVVPALAAAIKAL